MNHVSIFLLFTCFSLSLAKAEKSPGQLSHVLMSRLDGYHKSEQGRDHKLRLVYFHPNDAPPQKGYRDRLTRIMLDIQGFIGGEMKRNGFGDRSIKLEMDGDRVRLHMVEGRDGLDSYNYDVRYGRKILGEMRKALSGTIDFDRNFVLVFCSLCPRDEQGVYHFRSPYYGWGNSGAKHGLCFAADCEMLDTKHFTATNQTIRYSEHLGIFKKTLSAFNILYIGGIAHELGHGLGLPHNQEKPWEFRKSGRALMGSGNYTYRKELLGGKGSFLTLASALRLATHPMFTGSDRGRFQAAAHELKDLGFKMDANTLKVSGRVEGSPEIFAVIAYTDPDGGSNYDAQPWVSEVKEGRFELAIRHHRKGVHALRLNFCHLNGGFTEFSLPYNTDSQRLPLAGDMNNAWTHRSAESAYMDGRLSDAAAQAKEGLKEQAEGKFADKLRHLIALTRAGDPVKLSELKVDRFSLSDVEWSGAEVGWGGLARNQYFSGKGVRDGVCIELGEKFHPQAIYAHSPARHVFKLDSSWKKFTATVGLQTGVPMNGTGVFVVNGNGRELHRTKLLRGNETATIEVDVSGIDELELIAESGKEGNAGCWTVWGSPYVTR